MHKKLERHLIEAICSHWAWAGIDPIKIYRVNPFGNVIVKVKGDEYVRLIPEELKVEPIGKGKDVLAALESEDFMADWRMESLVATAHGKLGELQEDECYGFKIWPVLYEDGYKEDNIVKKRLVEWISASGDMGKQVEDLPEGASIKIVIEE